MTAPIPPRLIPTRLKCKTAAALAICECANMLPSHSCVYGPRRITRWNLRYCPPEPAEIHSHQHYNALLDKMGAPNHDGPVECSVTHGLRCSYFEQSVLPAGHLDAIKDYWNHTKAQKAWELIDKRDVNPLRRCECGVPLLPKRLLCPKCARRTPTRRAEMAAEKAKPSKKGKHTPIQPPQTL